MDLTGTNGVSDSFRNSVEENSTSTIGDAVSNRNGQETVPGTWPDSTSNHWRAVVSSPGGDLSKSAKISELGGWLLSLSLLAAMSRSRGSITRKPSAAHSGLAYSCPVTSKLGEVKLRCVNLLLRMALPTLSRTHGLRERRQDLGNYWGHNRNI